MIYPIEPRTRSVVASRFRAGDSVELLAEDYGISPEQVEAALREEWTPSFAEAEARAAAEGACDCVESEVARLRGLLGDCSDWIGGTCDVIGMSDTRLNAARVLLRRLAAALKEKDHG